MPRFHISPYRAAIFDLDGTLVHSEPAWELAKRRVLASVGREVSQDIYDAFVGRGLRGFLAAAMGSDLSEATRDDLSRRIGAEADVLLPQMRVPIPGAARSLAALYDGGFAIAICSSSPRRHIMAALEQLGVTSRVRAIVSGADLPRGKPDALPYLETLRLLDLPPAAAFAVEDALPGVRSAHAAGLDVVGIGAQSMEADFAPLCRVRFQDFDAFDRALGLAPS